MVLQQKLEKNKAKTKQKQAKKQLALQMKPTPVHNICKTGIALFWILQITKSALTLPFDLIGYLGKSNDEFSQKAIHGAYSNFVT